MRSKILIIALLSFLLSLAGFAQRPPRAPQAPRTDGPPRGGQPPRNAPNRPPGPAIDWIRPHDADGNGNLDSGEFVRAADQTFTALDRNGDGVINEEELNFVPRPPAGPKPKSPAQAPVLGENRKHLLPPFFFLDKADRGRSYSRTDFETAIRAVFSDIDKDGNGSISADESRSFKRPDGPPPAFAPPPPPNARFIGAELRFGDKQVREQPFSAETVTEDTRTLFDGSTVKIERRGAIYRDAAGRTRREQPLDSVAGISLVGKDNKGQKLIFINDFDAKTQFFIDLNNKSVRKNRIPDNPPPPPDFDKQPESKTENDGRQVIEGVACNLTRTEFEIPAGQIGNEKPLKVVNEKCFSDELQTVIMSLHHDPVSGIHLFKLVNIKRTEPDARLFKVPDGFRVVNQ